MFWLTICGLVALFAVVGLLDAIFDPTATERGYELLGAGVMLGFALLFGLPALRLLRGRARLRQIRGRLVVSGRPPVRARRMRTGSLLTPPPRRSGADGSTGPALARLTDAERALGEALYQLDLRREELEIPRDVVVQARGAALATASALRRWKREAPVTTSRTEVARPIYRGTRAIKELTSAVEAVLAGKGSVERVRTATGEVAEAAG